MTALRVLLADDHTLFRDGIASLLQAWDMEIVGQVGNGQDAISKAGELRPDLILMDIHMPTTNGIEATQVIKARWPEIKIVMLTVSEEDDHLFEAIKCGAEGYLLKNLNADSFAEMLGGLARGEAALPRNLASKILSEFARQSRQPHERAATPDAEALTDREMDVLRLLAEGLSNRAISERLTVTENTVKFHVRNILSKLNVSSRTEAATYAVRKGLNSESPNI